jgi:hypothetical protein
MVGLKVDDEDNREDEEDVEVVLDEENVDTLVEEVEETTVADSALNIISWAISLASSAEGKTLEEVGEEEGGT